MYLFAVPYTVLYTSHCRPLTWWAIVYGVFQFSSGKFLHSIYRVRSIMEILFLLSRFWWYYFFSFIPYFLLLHVTTLHRYMYMAVVIYLYNYFVVGKCVNMCSEYPSSASFIVALFFILFSFHVYSYVIRQCLMFQPISILSYSLLDRYSPKGCRTIL